MPSPLLHFFFRFVFFWIEAHRKCHAINEWVICLSEGHKPVDGIGRRWKDCSPLANSRRYISVSQKTLRTELSQRIVYICMYMLVNSGNFVAQIDSRADSVFVILLMGKHWLKQCYQWVAFCAYSLLKVCSDFLFKRNTYRNTASYVCSFRSRLMALFGVYFADNSLLVYFPFASACQRVCRKS